MNNNNDFLQMADKEIDAYIEVASKALMDFTNERGEGFDPIVSVATNAIIGSKVLVNLLEELGEDIVQSRDNSQALTFFLSQSLEDYQGKAGIMDIIQALLTMASSLSLSFAEDYYNHMQQKEEAQETVEQI